MAATLDGIGAAATPRVETLGGGAALPLPLYVVEAKGQPNTQSSSPVGAALPLSLLVSRSAWRSPAGAPPPPPPRRRAAAGRSLPQPLLLPLLDQGLGDVTGLHVC